MPQEIETNTEAQDDLKLVADASYELSNMINDKVEALRGDISIIAGLLRNQGDVTSVSNKDVTDMKLVMVGQATIIEGLLSTDQLSDTVRHSVVEWMSSQPVWTSLNDAQERLHTRAREREQLNQMANEESFNE